jgi:hypothetical protein
MGSFPEERRWRVEGKTNPGRVRSSLGELFSFFNNEKKSGQKNFESEVKETEYEPSSTANLQGVLH